MTHEKYYKYKHRIDFYLDENGITDLSDYRLGKTADENINIEHGGYTNIAKPSYEDLKKLVTKPNFIKHRNKNMIIPKLEFILKIKFAAGEYKRGEVIYNKYDKYPYIWFINPQCNSLLTGDDFIRFNVKDSVLYINNDFAVPSVNKAYYLSCVLIPKKDLNIPGDNTYTVHILPKKTIITSMNRGQFERQEVEIIEMPPPVQGAGDDSATVIKEDVIVPTYKQRNLYEHPEVIIPKTGSAVFKTPPRDPKKIKVTKEDVKKILTT